MRKKLALFLQLILISFAVFSQQKINGIVEDAGTGTPVSFATITTSEDGDGIMSDSLGFFSLRIRKPQRLTDSVLISAIGYSSKKILIRDLLTNNKVKLAQSDVILEHVKVFASLKGDHQQFGYFREFRIDTLTWVEKIDSARYNRNYKGNGEIGYVFEMPTKKFQLGRVQVKINHNYDTCWLKLHLRDMGVSGLGLPENEVLRKEIVLPVTLKYGLVEFDLNWEPISIPTKQIYVGFELQRCGCSSSAAPSFFFMGSEKGLNFYRENEEAFWKRGGEYTIYVRMITK